MGPVPSFALAEGIISLAPLLPLWGSSSVPLTRPRPCSLIRILSLPRNGPADSVRLRWRPSVSSSQKCFT